MAWSGSCAVGLFRLERIHIHGDVVHGLFRMTSCHSLRITDANRKGTLCNQSVVDESK
jgi:hypothetical protein